MAFVVVLFRGEEVARREISGPVVIGRSPECDISVRDILLSRRHCRISLADHGWAIEDLGSKNGTRIGGEALQWSLLKDGTSIRIGKTQVKFYTGSLSNAPPPRKTTPARRRPTDPFEALSGTVADFEYIPEGPARDLSRLPTPLPQPADPASYRNEDVYTMLTEIASSSWDSIYATASEPAAVMVAGQKARPLPVAGAKVAGADMPPRRRLVVTDASLQVDHPEHNEPTKVAPASSDKSAPAPAPEKKWLGPIGGMLRQVKHVLTGRFFRRAG